MKFSDVKVGMVVSFKKGDPDEWARFWEPMIRNPNYAGRQARYASTVQPHENLPMIVMDKRDRTIHDTTYKIIRGKTAAGDVDISEHWFKPDDDTAFQLLRPEGLTEQIRNAPPPKTLKARRNVYLGLASRGPEEFGSEGRWGELAWALKNSYPARGLGGRRKTRRHRRRRHTRKY